MPGEAERQHSNSPPALASEVEKLSAKLTEYEDRERRLNLRIYSFPEHAEDKDAISFLTITLPEILGFGTGTSFTTTGQVWSTTKALHRTLPEVSVERTGEQFAREIGDVHWKSHKISFCQDFSEATQKRCL